MAKTTQGFKILVGKPVSHFLAATSVSYGGFYKNRQVKKKPHLISRDNRQLWPQEGSNLKRWVQMGKKLYFLKLKEA